MNFLRQVVHIARYELGFVFRFPKMLIASLAVTLILRYSPFCTSPACGTRPPTRERCQSAW